MRRKVQVQVVWDSRVPNGRKRSDEIGQKQIKKQRTSLFKRAFSLGLVPTPEPLSPGPQWPAAVLKDGLADGTLGAVASPLDHGAQSGSAGHDLGSVLVCQLHKLQ